uniref:hypothetical protein n=1 Tax=Sulfolobus sp. NOB8H2 TaxID=84600 RepID=UPI00210403F8|nr:hypothetical protein [Sulfolobus sp. NOB8H2]
MLANNTKLDEIKKLEFVTANWGVFTIFLTRIESVGSLDMRYSSLQYNFSKFNEKKNLIARKVRIS